MSCTYTYQGETYELSAFDDLLRAMPPTEASKYMPDVKSVPSAPLISDTKSWVSLALKRAIMIAVEGGYEKVAFISGQQAADLYDLSKQVRKVVWTTTKEQVAKGTGSFYAYDLSGKEVINRDAKPEELEDIIGKDVAKRLLATTKKPYKPGSSTDIQSLEGVDLQVGGEGMKTFYDKIVPQVANDVLKRLGGGKVEVSEISQASEGDDKFSVVMPSGKVVKTTVSRKVAEATAKSFPGATVQDIKQTSPQPSFTLTPALREKAAGGLPLFSKDRNPQANDRVNSEAFKAWYGDWSKQDERTENDGRGIDAVPAVQRDPTLGEGSGVPVIAGPLRFSGASGPTGEDGRPAVFYHGTRSDIRAFELNHPGRKDHGWLGIGVYLSTDPWVGHAYADAKRGDQGPTVMPLYAAIKRPYLASQEEKNKLSRGGPKDAAAFTQRLKSQGYDGVALANASGSVELVAFEPSQVKSVTGNNGNFDAANPDITKSRSRVDMIREMALPAGYQVSDLLNSSGTVNWWDKTVGSPYNLAQRKPEFKRVYDGIQTFLSDVSRFGTRAADMAPNILPKLEHLKDILRSPLAPSDIEALRDPIFQGTLSYARDDAGAAVLTDDVGLAGVVWKDEELRSMFGLNDRQIALYREFRKATNKSLNDLGITDMVRYVGKDGLAVREQVLNAPTAKAAYEILADHLAGLAQAQPARADLLQNTVAKLKEKAGVVNGLVAKGYAPLSRFGDRTVYVKGADGEQIYFGMFESDREANKMARAMREQYPEAKTTTGTMSKESYKLFSGVTPETLALFGEALGLEESATSQQSQVFQEYLKTAKNNRSAMKRMIERKGIAGYSEDFGRVLAGFVYSNSRQASINLHAGDIGKAVSDVGPGDLKDQAIKLQQYVQNPAEEAQALRGLLFTQYIGGSLASALVNLTQSMTTTWPTLSMHYGITRSGKAMGDALKIATKGPGSDTGLAAAMKRAEEEGVTAPQEVHQLMAQAGGKSALQSGDGTHIGNSLARASNTLTKIQLAWGKMFGFAETMNRKIAFAAAFKLAREAGEADPYAFAAKIVAETQYVMNKGNNPNWARGPVGATLFTFRKFMVNYLEGLARMYGQGPEGKKAFALSLAIMFLMAGTAGFPFADDLDDLIDGFAQRVLGKNFSSKQQKKEFFAGILGNAGADFVLSGISGIPGVPIDVSGRMGMGNIVPGSGMLTKKKDYTRDVTEVGGAALDFVSRVLKGSAALAQGDFEQAHQAVMPVATSNVYKAIQMAKLGYYQDAKGRKVIDTTLSEAVLKGLGFQPSSVKQIQDATRTEQQFIALNKLRESEIADLWTRGRVERDQSLVEEAKEKLATWNKDNPDSKIVIEASQISRRVQQAMMDKAKRLTQTAPKEIRKAVKASLDRVTE